ncbi:HAD-IA family hydrolase [Bacteroides eggerthii]|jgi:predicted HAD superfamily hydrolase|uniref:HAD-IA family hydrolase n=3 Tax=Bacteroides eggerthii TaxID=28111 RepID=UPI001C376B00|nr:HAD-IA family hydrolase [Bacteroides eggerthii]MBV3843216.1 HAD-IA family hydrolase [Bacteroides eggerthii]MBV3846545.1 HAD-IA family hydrolase [Bacteroides eggerthii]MBV3884311.1 HAD-IA family hydrolase [Bacteroides eggerthii]MBV3919921.1 HAD-IA family hydrolase [Bacteroides eggerthii]MBV3923252.1 HAD-IA family hydrolase [Bacteroides eggerthii]
MHMDYSRNIQSYYNYLSSYTYISFDIFDTLIFRTVSDYRDIHRMVQRLYFELYGVMLDNYPVKRMNAEFTARSLRGVMDIDIDMIYDHLSEYTIQEKQRLMALEEKCELDNCIPNPLMADVCRLCYENGKKIVITTDMYLPRTVLHRILQKIKVKYDFLFISGEEGYTKRNGELFSVVLNKLSISPLDIIHIGDDMNNDIIMPKKKGISSLSRLINSTKPLSYLQTDRKNDLAVTHLNNFLQINYTNNVPLDSEHRIGYYVLGPLTVDFCQWVHIMKQEHNLKKLLFVAREGYFIKQVYEEMYPDEVDEIGYIRLNKNLLRLPLLSIGAPCEYFMRAKLWQKKYTWNLILDMLYITDYERAKSYVTKHIGFTDFDMQIDCKELEEGKYNNILLLLFEYIKDKIVYQSQLFDEYISSLGLCSSKIGLVNNSINGSGQSMLTDFLSAKGKSCDIIGLQFFKSSNCERLLGDRCRAWLTENKRITRFSKMRFYSNCLLMEHLMFEPQGTSLYLCKKNSAVEVCCETPRTEKSDYARIAKIQQYALCFVKDYLNHICLPLEMAGFDIFYRMLCYPLYDDALLLCHLNDDDFGGDKKIANMKRPFHYKYLFSKDLPSDISWKEGYFTLKGLSQWSISLYLSWLKCLYTKNSILHIFKELKNSLLNGISE